MNRKDLKNNFDVFSKNKVLYIYTDKSSLIPHLLKEWVPRFVHRDNNA